MAEVRFAMVRLLALVAVVSAEVDQLPAVSALASVVVVSAVEVFQARIGVRK